MILITKQFALANKDNIVGKDKFGYGVTINGDYFCDKNSVNTHPKLFEGVEIVYIEVTNDDLPIELI